MNSREDFDRSGDSISSEPEHRERTPQRTILRPEVQSPSQANTALGSLGNALPDMMRRAQGFYARHPTLVKTVGTLFVAAMARRLTRGRWGGLF